MAKPVPECRTLHPRLDRLDGFPNSVLSHYLGKLSQFLLPLPGPGAHVRYVPSFGSPFIPTLPHCFSADTLCHFKGTILHRTRDLPSLKGVSIPGPRHYLLLLIPLMNVMHRNTLINSQTPRVWESWVPWLRAAARGWDRPLLCHLTQYYRCLRSPDHIPPCL